jgi:hypothetical protein
MLLRKMFLVLCFLIPILASGKEVTITSPTLPTPEVTPLGDGFVPDSDVSQQICYKKYVVAFYDNYDDHTNDGFQILKDGKIVYSLNCNLPEIVNELKEGKIEERDGKLIGTDINRDGTENMVIKYEDGRGELEKIFELYPEFKEVAEINGELWGVKNELEKNSKIAFRIFVPLFRAYHGPVSEVILQWDGKRYAFAKDLMVRPDGEKQVEDLIRGWNLNTKIRKYHDFDGRITWGGEAIIMSLVFSGNSKLVWEAFDRIWKDKAEAKEYKDFVKQQIWRSKYQRDIKTINSEDKFLISPLEHQP